MLNITDRRIIYCLPSIFCQETIKLGNLLIRPLSEAVKDNDNCAKLLMDFPFNRESSVIETLTFKSGDFFTQLNDLEIRDSLEILKFSYFFEFPSSLLDINGFVGNETFECYPVIELNSELTCFGVEHKMPFTNGMSNYLLSLKSYFQYRTIFLENFSLRLKQKDFSYYSVFYGLNKKTDTLDLFKMYNKCWGVYSAYDFSDKALYSKITLELLSSRHVANGNKVGKTFTLFFEKLRRIIGSIADDVLFHVYKEKIDSKIDIVTKRIEDYFLSLNVERKNIAHEGKSSHQFINVAPYLVFFPVFLMVLECSDDIQRKDIYRFIFLLSLFMYEVDTWQMIDFETFPSKRTHLQSYINFSRCYHKYVKDNKESAKYMLIGFENWLKEIDG
ncbi:hypothetical protein N2K17_26485 [Klebsiella michiganensis]|uniref:hypothetical protein n=1 Tax=Klebsiella michiganensis TaxID=1134687 RepID=UPI002250D980|nr:hypothetical protein [Klebsiella michiganensis]MCX3082473.1 hypothetical protein [Klebsiella michiganensis]MCY0822558.1 hypothetical protein [Klebsiella michiganensis]